MAALLVISSISHAATHTGSAAIVEPAEQAHPPVKHVGTAVVKDPNDSTRPRPAHVGVGKVVQGVLIVSSTPPSC